ncbi:hypothetical protein D3C86_1163410 [compost metagenome]
MLIVTLQEVRPDKLYRTACKLFPATLEQLPHASVPVARNQPQIALQRLEAEEQMVMWVVGFSNLLDPPMNNPLMISPII